MNKIQEAFNNISAEDSLRQNTLAFLQRERKKRGKRLSQVRRYAVACAVMLAVIFGIGGYKILNTAVSYISIDITPSVELGLNRFNNVVEAASYNDDGVKILKNIDLKGKSYTEAIDSLLKNQEFISYIEEDNRLDFTVVSDRQDEIVDGIQKCEEYNRYNGCCHGANSDDALQARECGLSVGKYRAYTELNKYDETVTIEDCRNMTMKQIYDKIKECSGNDISGKHHNGYGAHKRHRNGKQP